MGSWINRTFAGGEIAPSLQVRGDQVKYQTGINLGRNLLIRRDGSAWNRQGTGFIDEVDDSAEVHRNIGWVFNNNLSYVLELGDQTMRFIKNGSPVTIAAPAAYAGGTTYSRGEFVVDAGINYYSLKDVNLGNTPAANPYYWYALTDDIMEIPTPWTAAELFDIKYDQQGDVMHLVHPESPSQKLTRTSDTGWIMYDYVTVPDIPREGQFNVIATSVVGTIVHNYKMTIVDDNYQESLPIVANGHVYAITGVTAADPVVVTAVGHTFVDGDEVILFDTGIPELDGRSFIANNVAVNTFELEGIDGSTFQTSVTGYAGGVIDTVTTGVPTESAPTQVVALQSYFYQAPSGLRTGDVRYINVYKDIGSGFGYIGSVDVNLIDPSVAVTYIFNDTGVAPQYDIRPPRLDNWFEDPGKYPSTVQFIQQRLAFGSSNVSPQTIWLSRIGFYDNFTTSELLRADDAINFIPSGRTIDKVEHLVDATQLIVLTQGGEWVLRGDDRGTIRSDAINADQIGYEGADRLRPVVIGNTVLYMQARSKLLRAIGYNNDIKGFDPNDLAKWAGHLFEDATVVDWDYQKLPDSILWLVMSDGSLVTVTFIIEEAIVAFTRHETDGNYESVCVVPEGIYDIPYFIVQRDVDGNSVRYNERMPPREISDVITEAYFMDSFITYDGTNTGATTMTLSGGPPWTYNDGPFLLDSSVGYFTAGDIGDSIVLNTDDDSLTCTITGYNGTTQVEVEVNKDVPAAFQGVAMTTWCRGIKTFSGLDHLEGKTVAVLADGNVLEQETVTGAEITVDDPYCIVRIGIPYNTDLETLDLELGGAETFQDRKKRVSGMTIVVKDSRGGWAGPDENSLREIKTLAPANWNSAEDMVVSGRFEMALQSSWQEKGKLYIRQSDPLPLHVLALIPNGIVGGS